MGICAVSLWTSCTVSPSMSKSQQPQCQHHGWENQPQTKQLKIRREVVGGRNGQGNLLRFWQVLKRDTSKTKQVQLTGPMDGLLPSPDSTHTYHEVIKNRRNRKWDQDGARDSIKTGFFAPWPILRFNIFWPLPQLLYPTFIILIQTLHQTIKCQHTVPKAI